MKNILLFTMITVCFSLCAAEEIHMQEVQAREHVKMKILIGLISPTHELKRIARVMKEDLEFTGQFEIDLHSEQQLKANSDIRKKYEQGYALALYLEPSDAGVTWRLYDTADARMIKGKKMGKHPEVRGFAHALSDDVWPEVMGAPGFFSSKIVYAKQVCRRGRNCKRYIYVRDATDATGESEQLLVSSPTINVAPRWNRDLTNPLVLFSQFRETNVALIAVDMKKRKSVVSNFDGVNMQVAYCPDGNQVVYCLSRAPGSQYTPHITSQLYFYSKDDKTDATFKRLTTNQGNNFGPCWGPEQTIFYSTDATKNGLPNICVLDLKNNEQRWITEDSYATSPSYSPLTNQLVYTKMINKKMQVWLYDLATQKHEQLTFDTANKDDCSWSPCGRLVAFSAEDAGQSRVVVFNLLTKESRFLTNEGEDCGYPSWSPRYTNFPLIG